ncbi:MAG: acyl-CoA dehydrogenase family protein [Deltaproteobacteria bacterium]|jgi:alkylation response protein AidB-like acyl-CoA dehydrogenase|nr:acyl-CoA dehydrogenase family protein [Deltaproteobacteria bacterium]
MNRLSFSDFLQQYQKDLQQLLSERPDIENVNHIQGISAYYLNKIHTLNPLSVFIPEVYGGRGDNAHECLKFLEISSYESIAIGLMMGINGSLFLEPVSKYGTAEAKQHVFKQFIEHNRMGGLMITEPEFGTDALSMQTKYQRKEDFFHIQGTKHWGGLTGMADFWLVTARQEKVSDKYGRDIDFFICEMGDPNQQIEVSEFFQKLGLFLIPYGTNKVDIKVPSINRLVPIKSGLKMLMDLLHRSRMRLSGIGIGFIKRMLDEAFQHTYQRKIGGQHLSDYDQVQFRLNQLQAWFTVSSAMCRYSALNAGTEQDLSGLGLTANAMKAVLTDMMQDSAQSLLQLVGAKGFRRDHIAGRAIVDCRPFQIFEGSNDVMYFQVTDMILNKMKKIKINNLTKFVKSFELTQLTAGYFEKILDFQVVPELQQRQKVILGKVISRLITLNQTLEMGNKGYNEKLIQNAVLINQHLVADLVASFTNIKTNKIVDHYLDNSDWLKNM